MQRLVKHALTSVGGRCSSRTVHRLNAAVNYVEVGRWVREHGFGDVERVGSRLDVFEAIARDVRNDRVLYLEFGVYEGDSMRWWSANLSHPEAQLYGFDSFEGLPETWSHGERTGHFSTGGRVPELDDVRVRFVKGWFDDTLPSYEAPEHDRLVAVLDADLYSSTAFVLEWLQPKIVPGTYLYFDEFHDRMHELRAFDEFLAQRDVRFRAVAATKDLSQIAFECLA